MTSLTSERFIAMFRTLAERIEQEKGYLCELDGHIGDADHGIAMAQGFAAVRAALDAADASAITPTEVFNTAAKSFLNAVGASSGPLYATAFMRTGTLLKGKAEAAAEDGPAVIEAMAKGIQERGKAEIGEKTMIDAWLPAAHAVAAAREAGKAPKDMLQAAADAAQAGADGTKDMVASKGRSSRLGERSLGHMDPGAVSAAMIVRIIAASLSD
ncbi:dihydroxyacetone kinase subunit L [Metarhizobium album]|uniref:Dihydroxyacetone kinase subunit L n=1 Tax=Metarhizobium album TaxID=2182425 RepID=A0A2U2DIF4_9HYPH|nr:dihydroxyacetone kinase subunit DhaL [Rhizobium album]PWE53089.1 dihydroxyacetone kinase subunit L [Rhizobium album]